MAETDTPTLTEVPLDEAMSMAILFQRNGKLSEAAQIYTKILALVPDHVDALHFAGVLAHQEGRHDEAVRLIERSLAINPDQPDCHSNLGIVFRAQGDIARAVAAYRQAIALKPDHANAYNNLGVLQKLQGDDVAAEAAYRTAIELNPQHVDAYTNLGSLLHRLRRTEEAVVCYCKVTTLSPRHPEARRLLALAHCTLGEPHKAVEIFEEWLRDEPGNAVAQHMLAACSGRDVPTRASDAYVEKVFDDFANSFDAKLAQLSYRAPQIVAAMLADTGAPQERTRDLLDLGCGTGLCGPLLAPWARRLVGVDLSSRMLAEADRKAVYDQLVKAELTDYLQRCGEQFDVIVSADTLVYFGELEAAIVAAAAALRPDGWLLFTVEAALETAAPPFRISTHGRYQHRRDYLARVLADAGLRGDIVPAELRMEAGAPVAGLAVRALKPAAGIARLFEDGVGHG